MTKRDVARVLMALVVVASLVATYVNPSPGPALSLAVALFGYLTLEALEQRETMAKLADHELHETVQVLRDWVAKEQQALELKITDLRAEQERHKTLLTTIDNRTRKPS